MSLCVCNHCKKIFKSSLRISVCLDCKETESKNFEIVLEFLKQYPLSNAMQISKGTKIPTKTLIRFIDEGKLHIVEQKKSSLGFQFS